MALCGLIVVLAGPVTAQLLIPTHISAWPAGGTDYDIVGTPETLWPDALSIDHVGEVCSDPNSERVLAPTEGDSSCIWFDYGTLAQAYRDGHQTHLNNITITDDGLTRSPYCETDFGANAYTLAPHLGASSACYSQGYEWLKTIQNLTGTSSHAHYKRLAVPPWMQNPSYMPAVRAACTPANNITSPSRHGHTPY